MTDYIEEMMKTAAVELVYDCMVEPAECKYLYWEAKPNCDTECDIGKNFPSFTAEKQLEIIMQINLEGFEFTVDLDNGIFILYATPSKENRLKYLSEEIKVKYNDFVQALALLTLELMNAGELDKEKVKEILEC